MFFNLLEKPRISHKEKKNVTISAVVPCILSLNHHLENHKEKVRNLGGLSRSLQGSLQRRFRGVFVNMRISDDQSDGTTLPFSDPPENIKEDVSVMIKSELCFP